MIDSEVNVTKADNNFIFHLGYNFDYNQTYHLTCSKGSMSHAKMDLKFRIIKISNPIGNEPKSNANKAKINTASMEIGIGVASIFFVIVFGTIVIIKKQRSTRKLNLEGDAKKIDKFFASYL